MQRSRRRVPGSAPRMVSRSQPLHRTPLRPRRLDRDPPLRRGDARDLHRPNPPRPLLPTRSRQRDPGLERPRLPHRPPRRPPRRRPDRPHPGTHPQPLRLTPLLPPNWVAHPLQFHRKGWVAFALAATRKIPTPSHRERVGRPTQSTSQPTESLLQRPSSVLPQPPSASRTDQP